MSSARDTSRPQRSVRYRLLAIALVPMLLILPVLLGIGILAWLRALDELKISKVSDDLTIAQQYLLKLSDGTETSVVAVAQSYRFHQLLFGNDNAALSGFLRDAAGRQGFDFLYLVDDKGRVLAGAATPQGPQPRWDWPVVAAALGGAARVGLDVFSAGELAAIAPALAEKARIALTPPSAAQDGGAMETRGLVLHSAGAVTLPDGGDAALVAGILLNHNLAFVDRINDLVYHGPSLLAGSLGSVTLFLDDIRISTNTHLSAGPRAIGTRVSNDVKRAVLGEGRTWLDSAFVVNDQFVSGYAPLLDTYGRRIGMLYVGYLEKPITRVKLDTAVWTFVALLIAAAITVPIFLAWAASIFRPLERIDETIARIEDGELDARSGAGHPRDEIGRVATRLDQLLDQIQERENALRQVNGQLRELSEQRTLALREKASQLETTIEQLVMSEKLATIGEITASIAHEINNPVAIMLGNLELVREFLGPARAGVETELELLEQQAQRISEIISRLLRFAKPHEYSGGGAMVPGDVITETLPFVRHLLGKSKIAVIRDDRARGMIAGNRVELQQVLINLIVNAAHAMPDGGELRLASFDQEQNGRPGVAIEVADTGIGMRPETLQRIFEPFFTTRVRDGNGLGLSISRMLVSRQGGQLSATSVWGAGSTFSIWLPAATE